MIGAGLLALTLAGATPIDTVRAHVTYLMGTTVYLDAGREDGLLEGQDVRVLRGAQVIAQLKVTSLASHRAACTINGDPAAPLAIGDTVAFVPTRVIIAQADTGRAAVSRAPPRRHTDAVRGRVGFRYLLVQPPDGPGFSQPGLDLRLDVARIGATPLGLAVDVRGRRTYRTRADGTVAADRRDAVYQAAMLVRPGGPVRATLGRQYLPTVSSVSLFDGALVEYQTARFGMGGFGGSEPDPATMSYSGDVRDYGVFVEGRSATGGRTRWTLAGGAVGSYASGGVVNREFGFLQGSFATPGFSAFLAQEVDLNRGWKADAGEPKISLTSTFATLVGRPADWVSLQAGIDNRRNVRLYRDYANPEAVFDDSFRQGAFAGASFTVANHARFGLDGRATFGGADSASRTRSGGVSLAIDRLTRAHLGLRGRATRYLAPGRSGWLESFGLLVRPVSWAGLEGNGGFRNEDVTGEEQRHTRWLGADLDLTLGRSLYVLLSGSHESGTFAAGDQAYVSLSFRF